MVSCNPQWGCPYECGKTLNTLDDYLTIHDLPENMRVIVQHATHSKFHVGLLKYYFQHGRLTEKQQTMAYNPLCCQGRRFTGGAGWDYPEGRNDIGEAMGGKYDQGGGYDYD